MLRIVALPPSKFGVEPNPVQCVARAFEIARVAYLERDRAAAMHAAASWLQQGLDAPAYCGEEYDDGN